MFGLLYLALFAFGGVLLLATIYRDRAEVFSSAFAGLVFALLALQSELVVVSGGDQLSIAVAAPVRYVLFAVAVLSWLLTIGSAMGYYSVDDDVSGDSQRRTNL